MKGGRVVGIQGGGGRVEGDRGVTGRGKGGSSGGFCLETQHFGLSRKLSMWFLNPPLLTLMVAMFIKHSTLYFMTKQ